MATQVLQAGISSKSPVTRTRSESGYETNVFAGKEAQMTFVSQMLKEKGFIPEGLVSNEVSWFYG